MTKKVAMPAASASQSISQTDFERFLHGLVMCEVSLQRVQAEVLDREAASGNVEVAYGERFNLISAEINQAEVHASYAVRLLRPDDEEPVAEFQVTYRVLYGTAEEMTVACFEQLRQLTLRIHTVPFAREWFRDISARMGVKPILLPLSIAHPAAVPNVATRKVRKKE